MNFVVALEAAESLPLVGGKARNLGWMLRAPFAPSAVRERRLLELRDAAHRLVGLLLVQCDDGRLTVPYAVASPEGEDAVLTAIGAQVLDLEDIARHRGSVLGSLPGEAQPSQKMFESLVRHALDHFDPARPIFVEAESKKIGALPEERRTLMRVQLLAHQFLGGDAAIPAGSCGGRH